MVHGQSESGVVRGGCEVLPGFKTLAHVSMSVGGGVPAPPTRSQAIVTIRPLKFECDGFVQRCMVIFFFCVLVCRATPSCSPRVSVELHWGIRCRGKAVAGTWCSFSLAFLHKLV